MATIKDIAKQAGVTPSTVSRVLNHAGGYNEATKIKVEKIAASLHYQKNEYASNLVGKKSNLIGVIITDSKSSFASPIIDSVEDSAYQNGIRILLAHCGQNDPQRLRFCLDLMAGQKVTGIISVAVQFDNDNLNYLNSMQIPLISLNVSVPDHGSIKIDDVQAAYDGTKFLIESGYQKTALVGVDSNDPQTGLQRITGYRNAMNDANIPVNNDYIVEGDFSFDAGFKAASKLLASSNPPRAIFAASDDAAAGVLSYAYDHNIKIPAELAVLGFDNSHVAQIVTPALTTINQPFAKMGQLAVQKIINKEFNEDSIVKYQILKRQSV
ncbi:LacI family DNA-binding transcriptional regulator [Paucilactobacillus suebicus]|uniref:Transcription regulator n=1 Tax=Paucilactobacillus suebicus DSM 5007 = KCTC 3549 TaxID=1423807 RepID=A0A0R1VW15_9LACO|nr:LacI family DNA-binding transcriptional regulator [Paucilactobacillus suebicus]KRM09573.1 transcription regulator [Paucilactobacillus suebicus DSM 5007 = KCTC 3549]